MPGTATRRLGSASSTTSLPPACGTRWSSPAIGIRPFVNDIKKDFSNSDSATVATEFVGTSISSNGDGIIYGPYYGPMIPANPHIKFFDGDRRGYVRCLVDRDQWRSDLRMVSTVSRSDAPVSTFASFVVENGRPGPQTV
jgi:alkaline phosphatase D